MRRFVVLVVALAAGLSLGLLWGAFPAFADDAPPPMPSMPFPPGISGPTPTVHATPTPGPTYVITPGTKGSQLPAPVTTLPSIAKPQASSSPHATSSTRSPSPSPSPGTTPTLGVTEVAAPVAGATATSSATDTGRWWMIGAAGFLLLVLSEFARLDLRGRKHPLPVR